MYRASTDPDRRCGGDRGRGPKPSCGAIWVSAGPSRVSSRHPRHWRGIADRRRQCCADSGRIHECPHRVGGSAWHSRCHAPRGRGSGGTARRCNAHARRLNHSPAPRRSPSACGARPCRPGIGHAAHILGKAGDVETAGSIRHSCSQPVPASMRLRMGQHVAAVWTVIIDGLICSNSSTQRLIRLAMNGHLRQSSAISEQGSMRQPTARCCRPESVLETDQADFARRAKSAIYRSVLCQSPF